MGGRGTSSGFPTHAPKAQLPPLDDNIMGVERIFHDAMNADATRGDNNVTFTSGIKEDVFIRTNYGGYYVDGTFEILKSGNEVERVSGMLTTDGKRMYGITQSGGYYNVTDLRTGMLVSQNPSLVQASLNAPTAMQQALRNPALVQSAEMRFKNAHG